MKHVAFIVALIVSAIAISLWASEAPAADHGLKTNWDYRCLLFSVSAFQKLFVNHNLPLIPKMAEF